MPDYKYETLLVEQDESVLTITLNRPERLNAVNEVMHGELERVFAQAGADGEAVAQALGGGQHVRGDLVAQAGEVIAGAAITGLDLVQHQ